MTDTSSLELGLEGWGDGSAGKVLATKTDPPEFSLWDPNSERRELTLTAPVLVHARKTFFKVYLYLFCFLVKLNIVVLSACCCSTSWPEVHVNIANN